MVSTLDLLASMMDSLVSKQDLLINHMLDYLVNRMVKHLVIVDNKVTCHHLVN